MIHHLQMAQNMLEKDYGLEKIRVRKLIEEEISHQKL